MGTLERDQLASRLIRLTVMQNELAFIISTSHLLTEVQWAEINKLAPRLYMVADHLRVHQATAEEE